MSQTLLDLISWYQRCELALQDGQDPFVEFESKQAGELIQTKVDRMSFALAKMKSNKEFFAEEIKKYQAAKKVIENGEKRLRELMKLAIQFSGDDLQGTSAMFKLVESGGSVILEDPTLVPPKYTVITTNFDKARILRDLRQGIKIPGCRLAKGKSIREYKRKD